MNYARMKNSMLEIEWYHMSLPWYNDIDEDNISSVILAYKQIKWYWWCMEKRLEDETDCSLMLTLIWHVLDDAKCFVWFVVSSWYLFISFGGKK